ncbi:hypothetical protein WJX74_005549 [Apatococcus lobatus]|uniref:Uncharacterized protein n=1 Tax=Apatococcus lobatus TaxID=904363 RepID=A0AAW1QZW4_9CHLO
MIAGYLEKARRWMQDTVRSSAIRGLSDSVEGKRLKRSLPPLLTFIVVAAVLSGQLLLKDWPRSFAAFLLASPLVSSAMLAALAVACQPSSAAKVPTYACVGVVVLAALQCVLGAFAMCLPVQLDRTVFSLLSAAVVLLLCLGISKSFVNDSIRHLAKARAQPTPAKPQPDLHADADEDDSDDFAEASPSQE